MSSKLTISLVTWNGARYMRDCLTSLLEQSVENFHIIMLDNGSTDETVAIAKEMEPKFGGRLEIRINSTNAGFAKGHNTIISESKTPYIMVLNQDLMLERDYLWRCTDFLDHHSRAGSVSGKLLRWDASEDGRLKNKGKTNIIDSLGLKIFKSQRVVEEAVGQTDDGRFEKDMEVFGVSGTAPIYRREALESVKQDGMFFDEDFFSYKEDVDLAYRLRWQGWSAWTLGRAKAYHDRSARSVHLLGLSHQHKYRRSKRRMINYHSYKNQIFLLLKNLSPKNYLRSMLMVELFELMKFFYILILEPRNLAALGEVWKKLPVMGARRKWIMKNRKVEDSAIARWFS